MASTTRPANGALATATLSPNARSGGTATLRSPSAATARSADRTTAVADSPRFAIGRTRIGDAIALALIAGAFALAIGGPATLVLVAPLVFGVPHVASDIRYLVVRGPLRANALMAIVVPLALIVGQRTTAIAGGAFSPHVELALGFAAVTGAAIAARGSLARTAVALVLVVAIAAPALAAPRIAMLVLLHTHNLVGIGLWLVWTRAPSTATSTHATSTHTTSMRTIVIAGAIAVCLAAILAGACDSIAGELGGLARTVAPDVTPVLAARIALAFAFLQAVHYIAWLYLIPRALDARPHGLVRDFGRPALVALAIAALAVPIAALAGDAAHVRELYLSVVVFHAWLEVAVAAYLIARRA